MNRFQIDSTFPNLCLKCINLFSAIDRRSHILNLQKRLNLDIDFFYAVDSKNLNIYDNTTKTPPYKLIQHFDQFYIHITNIFDDLRKDLSFGEYACAVSHIELYSQLLRDPTHDYYLILEDDVDIEPQDVSLLREQLSYLPKNFDVCLLSKCISFYPPHLTYKINRHYYKIEKNSFNMLNAYVISKSGAKKILNHLTCQNQNNQSFYMINYPADDLISILSIQNIIEVISVNKRLFGCQKSFPSLIWNNISLNESYENKILVKEINNYHFITNLELGLNGRLGNQIFQYISLLTLSLKLNLTLKLSSQNVERSRLKKVFKNIKYQEITKSDRIDYHYQELDLNFDPNLIQKIKNKNTNLVGYFQNLNYFYDYQAFILEALIFNDFILNQCQAIIDEFKDYLIISLHIRLGDIVPIENYEAPISPIITDSYIQKSINYIKKNYPFGKFKIFLFTDSPSGLVKYTLTDEMCIFNDLTDYQSLCLMSLCNHHIISCSTFSFWGAFLCRYKNKIVVRPEPWFNPKCQRMSSINSDELLPKDWIKMNIV